MRIAIYNNFSIYDIPGGGVEVTMDVYAEEMTKLGHEVHMIVERHKREEKIEEIKKGYMLHRINLSPTRLTVLYPLRKKLKQIDPDVLILSKFADTCIGAMVKKKVNIPMVVLAHDQYDALGGRFPFRLINKLNYTKYYKSMEEVIPVNENTKRLLEENSEMRNLQVCYTGFNIKTDKEKTTYRRYSDEGEPFTFLFLSRFQFEKGMDDLVDAFMKYNELYPNSKCVFIGKGKYLNDFRIKHKELINSGKIESCGFIPDEEVFDRMSKADIFIMPTNIVEGIVFSNVQAMKIGLPVITSDSGAITEVIPRDGKYGLVYRAGKVTELWDRMVQLSLDEEQAKEMATNAKERAKLFTAEVATQELMKHLTKYKRD